MKNLSVGASERCLVLVFGAGNDAALKIVSSMLAKKGMFLLRTRLNNLKKEHVDTLFADVVVDRNVKAAAKGRHLGKKSTW